MSVGAGPKICCKTEFCFFAVCEGGEGPKKTSGIFYFAIKITDGVIFHCLLFVLWVKKKNQLLDGAKWQ